MKNIGFAKAIRFKGIDEILSKSKKHNIFIIYGFLIYNASIGTRTLKYKSKAVTVERNQLIISKRELSYKLDLPFATIFRGLEYLKKAGVIEMESGKNYTLITIAESQNEQQEVQPIIEPIMEVQPVIEKTQKEVPAVFEPKKQYEIEPVIEILPTLTAEPIEPLTTPPKAKTKRIKKDSSEIVLRVFNHYIETINPLKKYVKKQAAKNNIELHLKEYSAELLISTIDNYKTTLDENLNVDTEWRKGPSNFFGVKGENKKYFLDHFVEDGEAVIEPAEPPPTYYETLNDDQKAEYRKERSQKKKDYEKHDLIMRIKRRKDKEFKARCEGLTIDQSMDIQADDLKKEEAEARELREKMRGLTVEQQNKYLDNELEKMKPEQEEYEKKELEKRKKISDARVKNLMKIHKENEARDKIKEAEQKEEARRESEARRKQHEGLTKEESAALCLAELEKTKTTLLLNNFEDFTEAERKAHFEKIKEKQLADLRASGAFNKENAESVQDRIPENQEAEGRA